MTQYEAQQIKELREQIAFRGTPEKGYTDSGLWLFLEYVYTKDEHDKKNPVKLLPVKEKLYLKILFLYMLSCDKLLVPKSRQIMASWAVAAYDVWSAMSAKYRKVLFQSKKEGDAQALVTEGKKNPSGGRMDFIVQHLPDWLKDENIAGGAGNLVGKLVFSPDATDSNGIPVPWQGSQIEAIPGGPDQVRSKTSSKITIDEGAFHDDLGKTITACKPSIDGGGQLHIISSVDAGSDFNTAVLDVSDPNNPEHDVPPEVETALEIMGERWPRGMRTWRTRAGFNVIEAHYTSDPAKDPNRDGAEWYERAVEGYVGGVNSRGWKTEMEIDYEAGGGERVFPFLADPLSPVFIDPISPQDALNRMDVFAGYDYGTNNPSAFVVWGIDEKGLLYALWELYEPCVNLAQHANRIKMCPYFDRLKYISADNKIFSKTQQLANGIKSIAALFHAEQIPMSPARQGVDYPMAIRFQSEFWNDGPNGFKNSPPRAFITADCPNLKSEVRGLRFQEHISGVVASRKNNAEKLVDKDNHTWDATAYAIDRRPSAYMPHRAFERDDSINSFLVRAGVSQTSTGFKPSVRRGIHIVGSAN